MILFESILIGLGAPLSLFLIGAGLYLSIGWFKSLYHDLLRWHLPLKGSRQFFDGCSVHSVCRHCNKNIIEDGQGNWFTLDE